jgi:predicted phage terminase large subunit-like protein
MTTPATNDVRHAIGAAARDELARRSLLDFAQLLDPTYERARHLELLAEHLEALERREIRRLLVTMPPRAGKSRMCSQLWPSWMIGRRPKQSVVLASYAAELSEQNSRRVRDLVTDERFPFIDATISAESRAVNRWATSQNGVVIAVGIGGGLTGFGADALIIDDPVADRADAESPAIRASTWDWYTDVARTRLHPNAIQLIAQTRWHEDDLAGRILSSDMGKDWVVLNLPAVCDDKKDPLGRKIGEALWPERFPIAEMPSVERGEISSRSFSALYQGRPQPAEGAIFKAGWFGNRYDELPSLKMIATGADCASKTGVGNDFSAIVTVGTDGKDYFILDVVRERLEFADLGRRMKSVFSNLGPQRFYIEDASSGTPLIQELRRTTSLPIIGVVPRGTKLARAEAVSGLFEAGKVRLPREAPWLDAFIDEFLRFPAGKHDDQVDATSLVLSRLRARLSIPEFSFAFASNSGNSLRGLG